MILLSHNRRLPIEMAGLLLFCCVYFFVFMEWLFYATKPSFFSSYTWIEKLGALGVAPLFFLPAIFTLFAVCVVVYLLLFEKLEFGRFTLLAVAPAVVATALTMLLVDDFVYTFFQQGIITLWGALLRVYLTLIFFTLAGWCIWFTRKIRISKNLYLVRRLSLALLMISLLSAALTYFFAQEFAPESEIVRRSKELPDIIIFSPDAIAASNVSTYGYFRQTTPNLDALAKDSLIVYNAIANAGRTTGSSTAILTGKFPTTTKVIFPPHTLRGRHSYQHLPGILKRLGYFTIQESVRYYADSQDLNMRGGFDYANGRRIDQDSTLLHQSIRYKFTLAQLLVERVWARVKDRALHLVDYRPMENAFDIVNPENIPAVYGISDKERLGRIIELIKGAEKPVFAHIHLMESHCCKYRPIVRKFSARHESQTETNVVDFYDDAILSADKLFGLLLDLLRDTDRFDNALIIFTSDHNRTWQTSESVPLIIHFPNGRFAGKRLGMSQLIDIAPTIIDFLGLAPLEWMEGRSLLGGEADFKQPVFTVDSVRRKRFQSPSDTLTQLVGGGPPTYGLKTMSLIDCDQNYILELETGTLNLKDFSIQADKCTSSMTREEAKKLLEFHLVRRGFEPPYL